MGLAEAQPGQHHRVGQVGLVDHDELGHVERVELGEDLAHADQLLLRVWLGPVDDVEHEVSLGDLLER
jgi:hypothetical protein